MNNHRLHRYPFGHKLKTRITQIVFMACGWWLMACGAAYAGIAVSVTGGNWAIGPVGAAAVKETTGNTWTVTNEGTGYENIYIKADGSDPSNPWHPGSATGTADTFVLKHDASGSWSDAITDSGNGIELKAVLASAGTAGFDLQFIGPISTTEASQRTMTVTLTAVAPTWYESYGPLGTNDVVLIGSMYVARNINTAGTANNERMNWDPAISWAAGLDWLGKTDWRLPTGNTGGELSTIYDNRASLGSYAANYYWSSTEAGATNAYIVNFGNGNVDGDNKTYTFYVRAVRAGQ